VVVGQKREQERVGASVAVRPPALFPKRDAAIVAAVALAFRAFYGGLYQGSPFFHVPVVDASTFHLWAEAIREHREFIPGVYFKPPLYPHVLAAVYNLFGPRPEPMYVLQALLGAGTSVLVLGLGRRLFSPRVGLLGALMCALLPVLPFLEFQLVAEPLTTFLTMAALVILVAGEPRPARAAAVGLLLGIAALGRPNLLILAPVLAWWTWRQHGRALGPVVALLAATGVGILPAMVHNLSAGKLVLVSANAGANLWTGVRPGADGVSAIPIGIQWDDLQLQAEQAGARGVAEADGWLMRRSFAAMAAEPWRALGLTARRALLLVNAHEGRNNIGAAYLARTQGVMVLRRWWPGFWLVAPLALLGLAAVLRPRWFAAPRPSPDSTVLLLALGALAVAILPFFVNARFRQPMLPLLALLAAHGLLVAVAAVRVRGRPALVAGALLLASFVVVNIDWYRLGRPEADAIDELNLAGILARGYDGHPADLGAAFTHLGVAAGFDPRDPDVPERWGLYLQGAASEQLELADRAGRAGRDGSRPADAARRNLDRAVDLHRRAITLFPRSFRSYGSAGNSHLMLGRLFVTETTAALAAGDTAAARARAVVAASQLEAGVQAWQAALQLKPSLPGARESIGAGLQILRGLPALDPAITAAKTRLGQ
jgi:4-amino-4-deoxy-L-arabinose transferase-like glycosyltransferase